MHICTGTSHASFEGRLFKVKPIASHLHPRTVNLTPIGRGGQQFSWSNTWSLVEPHHTARAAAHGEEVCDVDTRVALRDLGIWAVHVVTESPPSSEGELPELGEQRVRHEAEVHTEEDAADALGQFEASGGGDAVDADESAEEDDREGHQIGGVDLGGRAGGRGGASTPLWSSPL